MVLGSCIGLSITPLIVINSEDISIMNIVWFIPTAITFIMAILFVRSDRPPTPPSKSSMYYGSLAKMPYLKK